MPRDLRAWLAEVEGMGELVKLDGVHWDTEMGSLVHLLHQHSGDRTAAVLYDNVPGYPRGYRAFYGHFSTLNRLGPDPEHQA